MATPKLTAEEKRQRIKERVEERQKWDRLYPSASLTKYKSNYSTWLGLDLLKGERGLKVVQHGEITWYTEDGRPDKKFHYLDLNNLDELLRFISALIARYNAAVNELNGTASEVPAITKLEHLPEVS